MTTLHYRLDLDKTYLATPLEHKLQLLKVPFENPEAKRTLPGMAALVGSLQRHVGTRAKQAKIAILSASPSFMAKQLRAKLDLDGVRVDDFVFKDQWHLVKQGRFKEIGDPFAYKLGALCRLAKGTSDNDAEVLVGDDYDMDPIIYTMYQELRGHRVSPTVLHRFFDRHDARPEIRDEIWRLLDHLPRRDAVDRVFIRQDRRLSDEFYAALGNSVHVYEDAFQLALLLYDANYIDAPAIAVVAAELKGRRWRQTAFAFSWRGLLEKHFLHRYAEALRLVEELDLVPRKAFWERLTPVRRPEPHHARNADWDKVITEFEKIHPTRAGG